MNKILIFVLLGVILLILLLIVSNLFKKNNVKENYNIFDDIGDFFSDTIPGAFISLGDKIVDLAEKTWDEVYSGLKSIGYTFEDLADSIKDYSVDGFNSFKDGMDQLGDVFGDPDFWKRVGLNTFIGFKGLGTAYLLLQTGNIEGVANELQNTVETMNIIAKNEKPQPPDYTGPKITADMIEIKCPVEDLEEDKKKKCIEMIKFMSDPENVQALALKDLEVGLANAKDGLKKIVVDLSKIKLNNGKLVKDYLSPQDILGYISNYFLISITEIQPLYLEFTKYDDNSEQERLMKAFAMSTKPNKRKEIIEQMTTKLPQLFGNVSVNYPSPAKEGDLTRELTINEAISIIYNVINWEKDTENKNINNKKNYEMNNKPYIYNLDLLTFQLYRLFKGDLQFFNFYKGDNFLVQVVKNLDISNTEKLKEIQDNIGTEIKNDLNNYISNLENDYKNIKDKLMNISLYFSSRYPDYDKRFSNDKIVEQLLNKIDPLLMDNNLVNFIINNFMSDKVKGELIRDEYIKSLMTNPGLNPRFLIEQLPKNLFVDLMMKRKDVSPEIYTNIKEGLDKLNSYFNNNDINVISVQLGKIIDKCFGCFPAGSEVCENKDFSEQCIKDGCKIPASFECKSFLKGYTYPPTELDVPASCRFCYPPNKNSPYATFCTKECGWR
jgi:hypothetical protein